MHRTASLPVLLAIVVLVGLSPLPATAQDAEDYRQVVDLTFPTDPRATFTDDYDGARGDRVHRATDLMGEKMWPVYAAVGGEVTFVPGAEEDEEKPSYGYMIRIQGDDGRTYSYVHLNDDTPGTSDASGGPEHAYAPGLRKGSIVERGELIGYMGDSGNAKGGTPHLHFEIIDPEVTDPYGTDRINPYRSLRDAEERGDYAAEATEAPSADKVDRVAGEHRVKTAVALSKAAFSKADTVVIASASSFPDSVVAGPLAAALDAPVLTTFGDELEDEVLDEVNRLGASTAYIVGPRDRVSVEVERAIVGQTDVAPSDLHRRSGTSDADTAAVVARDVRKLTGSTDALVALSSHPEASRAWPDALTAGYHGAFTGHPVLFVDHDGVPEATLDALAEVDIATIVGGVFAVSEDNEAEVADVVADVRRLAGQDRFSTAAAVVDDLLDEGLVDSSRLWAATGHGYADALAAAGALAAVGELFILIDGTGEGGDEGLNDWFAERRASIEGGRVIGGEAAVSETARTRLAKRIE